MSMPGDRPTIQPQLSPFPLDPGGIDPGAPLHPPPPHHLEAEEDEPGIWSQLKSWVTHTPKPGDIDWRIPGENELIVMAPHRRALVEADIRLHYEKQAASQRPLMERMGIVDAPKPKSQDDIDIDKRKGRIPPHQRDRGIDHVPTLTKVYIDCYHCTRALTSSPLWQFEAPLAGAATPIGVSRQGGPADAASTSKSVCCKLCCLG